MPSCSSCSAPLPPSDPVCAYCGTRNSVDLECLHEHTVLGADERRHCPRCAVALEAVDLKLAGPFLVERCPECFGLFFDPGELEEVLERSVGSALAVDYRALAALSARTAPATVRYGRCPVCGTVMNRVAFGARSGVVADVCKGHGVWLDGGELRQLLEWKKAGGQVLDGKRQVERKEEERLRRERDRAASVVSGTAGGWTPEDETEAGLPGLLCRLAERLLA